MGYAQSLIKMEVVQSVQLTVRIGLIFFLISALSFPVVNGDKIIGGKTNKQNKNNTLVKPYLVH